MHVHAPWKFEIISNTVIASNGGTGTNSDRVRQRTVSRSRPDDLSVPFSSRVLVL